MPSAEEFDTLKREAVEGAAAWIPAEAHGKVLQRLKRVPPEERTDDSLDDSVQQVLREREGRLTEVLDEVASVLAQLGVEEQVITVTRGHLKNKAAFTGRIK